MVTWLIGFWIKFLTIKNNHSGQLQSIPFIEEFFLYLLPLRRAIYIIITKKISAISSETEGSGASFMTRTLQLRFREFGAPIIYMIAFPWLT